MRSTFVTAVRVLSGSVFVASIAGLIISSINGNNEGWVVTIGLVSAVTAIVLIAVSTASSTRRNPAFVDADAEVVELRIRALVDAGADEAAVRELVRLSLRLGRDS